MAKSSTRRVNIYINGKEVEGTIKQIRAEMNRLINEQNRMVFGSDEYIAHAKKIRELREVLKEHSQNIGTVSSAWSDMFSKLMQFGTGVGGFMQIFQTMDSVTSTFKQVATDLAELDDIYSDVMKTTGFTHEQVEELNECFKKMDTRTAREQLNNLAYIAGKLGLDTEDLVKQFVEAADIINVSMGDVLGDDATLAIGKMADVYKRSTEMLEEKDLKGQLLAIGSAVNELGQSSTANEAYMVNFAGRLGGIAVQAGLSADEILGFASALDQDMQKVEMSATAFQKLIQKIISKPAEFAKIAGMEVKKFTDLVSNDMNSALKAVLKGFSGTGGFDKLLPLFKDLGLDSARASAAISAMANSLDKVEEAQSIANQAMNEGVSCLNEFNTKNNNLQANLEKARKKFQDTRLELGEKLYPILLKLTKTSTAGIKLLSQIITWCSKNKAAVVALIAPVTLYIAKLTWLKTKMLAVNAVEKAAVALKSMHKVVTYAVAAAQAKLAGNTTRAAAAQRAMNAALTATPWVAIATAVAALGVAIVKLATKTNSAKAAVKDFRERMAEQKVETDKLFDSLRQLRVGSEAYNKVQKKIIDTYPQLLKDQVDEHGNIINIEQAYNKVIAAQKRKIAMDIQEERVAEVMKQEMKRLSPSLDRLSPEIGSKAVELAEGGMDANAITRNMNKYFLQGRQLTAKEDALVRNIVKIVEEQKKKIDQIKQSLAPWIGSQVDAVVEEIEQKVGGEGGEEGSEDAFSETKEMLKAKKTEWKNLQKQVKKMFEKDELIGLDKTEEDKQKIRQEYTALIEQIETFIQSKGNAAKELAAQVRTYMDNAIADIDREARTEKLKKVQDQYVKLCEQVKTIQEKIGDGLGNTYASELASIKKQWEKTFSELDANIAYYQQKASEEYNPDKGTGLNDEEQVMLENLLERKKQAITVQAQEELDVVKRAETEISETLLSETQKRVADIRKEYEGKIAIAQTAIAKLKQLGEQENEQQIGQLEEQIAALKGKMENEISEVEGSAGRKGNTGIARLLQVDWKDFKKDWEKNLSEIVDVLDEFASSAMQIFNSINQIQANNEQAQLDAYKKKYDERKQTLDNQLEQGIISQEYYNEQVSKLDEELDAKEKEIALEQFRREKKSAIAEAVISGIVSAIKSFENGGGFPWGLISMAMSLATTGAQVAAITSQPEPYARGGYIEREQHILAGEQGREWIASNQLLENPQTAPVIEALQLYQTGDRSAFENLDFAVPDTQRVSQAAEGISRNFAADRTQMPIVNNYNTTASALDGDTLKQMLEQMQLLNGYMCDPKNRQAVISRELQIDFEQQESFLRNAASLS